MTDSLRELSALRAEHVAAEQRLSNERAAERQLRSRIERLQRTSPHDPLLAKLRAEHERQSRMVAVAAAELTRLDDIIAGVRQELLAAAEPSDPFSLATPDVPFLLLPARLETRFANDRQGPVLLVRIYPDEVALDNHEPELSEAEVVAGKAYWEEAWSERATTLVSVPAWERLLRSFEPARAAWIVGALRPSQLDTEAPLFPEVPRREGPWSRPLRTRVMPDRWIVVGWSAGERIGPVFGAVVPDALQAGPDPVHQGDFPAWLSDFSEAERVGMAVRLPLSQAQAERGLTRLVAVGAKLTQSPEDAASALSALFSAHAHGAGWEVLRQGAPTNNTAEGRASGDRSGVQTLRPLELVLGPPQYEVEPEASEACDGQLLAMALGLDAASFARIDGSERVGARAAAAMIHALSPATFDYYLRQMIGSAMSSTRREAVLAHLREFLRPRGPLPAIRVGAQPYGILPCVDAARFQPETNREHGDLEEQLHALFDRARTIWFNAARSVPHLGSGTNAEETLVRILGQRASSCRYGLRSLVGGSTLWNLYTFLPNWSGLSAHWAKHQLVGGEDLAQLGFATAEPPLRVAGFTGRRHEFRGPLVQHEPLSEELELAQNYIDRLRSATLATLRDGSLFPEGEPNALLYLLLRHSLLRVLVDIAISVKAERQLADASDAVDRELRGFRAEEPLTPWAHLAEPVPDVSGSQAIGDFLLQRPLQAPDLAGVTRVLAGVDFLARLPTAELERLLTETLDAASHRLDAWLTSLATRRLRAARARVPSGIQLGGFAVVENIRRRSEGAQRGDGYFLAPSLDHAATAAVLRSAFLSRRQSGAGDTLSLDLSSARVRNASWLLSGVRAGFSLAELLGRRFERLLHDAHRRPSDPELSPLVSVFRSLYPDGGARRTLAPIQRVLPAPGAPPDGLRLLEAWRAGSIPFGSDDRLPASGSVEHAALSGIFSSLADDLDAVADLLLAETVHQAVQGRIERAAAAADALAGAGLPPEPEVARSPRGATSIAHRVMVLFAGAPTRPAGWADTARSRAEPWLDAWVGGLFGPPDTIRVRARVEAADDVEFALQDVGLGPLDLVALAAEDRATDLEALLLRAALSGQPAGSIAMLVRGRAESWAPEMRSLDELLEVARRVGRLVRTARPLTPADLVLPDESPPSGLYPESGPHAWLSRASEVEDWVSEIREALENALLPFPPDTLPAEDADLSALDAAMLRAFELGVTDAVPKRPTGLPGHSAARVTQARRVLTALEARAFAVGEALARGDAPAVLSGAFADSLVFLPRFAPPHAAALRSAFEHPALLEPEESDAPLQWLQQVARVSAPIGGFELALLAAEGTGGEPGVLQVAQLPFRQLDRWLGLPPSPTMSIENGRLSFVAIAPPPLDFTGVVAGLFVDHVEERIPNAEETAGLSVHFDSPCARAPNVLLLAVPPALGRPWSWEDLAGAAEEALELAKIRAVDLEALPALGHLLPAILLAFDSAEQTVSTDLLRHARLAQEP